MPAAEGSRLPCFTAVLADIGDEQSIERDLSTFTGHAANLAAIARAAGPRSLVLLDEPGAGTDPVEGAALAVGVLTDLLARGPLLVFTTHFPQVKTFALAEPALEVAAFDVDPATGAPRYQLDYHTVGQSLALPIARRHGLPARALEMAERLLAGESRDVARAVERLEASRRELDTRARRGRSRGRRRLAAARAETRGAARRPAGAPARPLERGSRGVAPLRARRSRPRGAPCSTSCAGRPEPAALRALRRAGGGAHRGAAGRGRRPPKRSPPAGRRGSGTRSRWSAAASAASWSSSARARPHPARRPPVRGPDGAAPRGRGRPADARPRRRAGGPSRAPRPRRARSTSSASAPAMPSTALGTFLDRAVRAGLSEVRVVHGVGTGALRRAVQEFLAASPYCVTYPRRRAAGRRRRRHDRRARLIEIRAA